MKIKSLFVCLFLIHRLKSNKRGERKLKLQLNKHIDCCTRIMYKKIRRKKLYKILKTFNAKTQRDRIYHENSKLQN